MPEGQFQSLFSVTEVARRWSISRGGVYNLIRQGRVNSITLGARRLISLAEIERFERNLTDASVAASSN